MKGPCLMNECRLVHGSALLVFRHILCGCGMSHDLSTSEFAVKEGAVQEPPGVM